METFLERYKNIMVLSAVLLAQFLGLAIQVRTPAARGSDGKGVRLLRYWVVAMMSPPEKVMSHTGHGARGFWGNYVDLRHTREENQALRAQVEQLRLEQAALLEDAKQGHRLQELLDFRQKYIYATVPAQVVGTSGSDQSRILTIDKGSKDGLKRDQPVITPDGIVGKLVEVFPHTSQVLEINDQTSGAGVLLEKTRMRGVLRGNAYGQPQIINVLPDDRVQPGEKVVTSGGDQIFPRGLSVGTVQKVVSDPDREPYVDIVLKPAANLQHLDEVLVVTETSEQLPAAAQRDLAKSEAAGAEEVEMQRASDVLAQKLPGLEDPNAPKGDDASKDPATDVRPLKPLTAAHPDRFSPAEVRPASQMTPGKAPVITSPARTSELLNEGPPLKHAKKPNAATDAATPADGTARPVPHANVPHPNQESFIIPGTATGPDRPLVNPEKTAAAKGIPEKNSIAITGPVSTGGMGTPAREQHQ
ncbi:MAG TPA: rod shape-determining protein MreC [Acidobacteriaceae bacterium]|jgi:rod shape-determining protein MreC|nr:rod shape-determining protein MreC [Acidobacteriaceae bacterium]